MNRSLQTPMTTDMSDVSITLGAPLTFKTNHSFDALHLFPIKIMVSIIIFYYNRHSNLHLHTTRLLITKEDHTSARQSWIHVPLITKIFPKSPVIHVSKLHARSSQIGQRSKAYSEYAIRQESRENLSRFDVTWKNEINFRRTVFWG